MDGRPNLGNKAAHSNFSGVVRTEPMQTGPCVIFFSFKDKAPRTDLSL